MTDRRELSLVLAKSWWSLWIRGFAAISLGLVTMIWRRITLDELILLFFGYAFVDGVLSIAGAFRAAQQRERGGMLLLAEGLLSVGLALVAVMWSGLTDLGEVNLIATWAGLTGVLELAAAVHLRKFIPGELLLALSGVASLALGGILAVLPLAGTSSLARGIGLYAFVFGILLTSLGIRLRSWVRPPAITPGY